MRPPRSGRSLQRWGNATEGRGRVIERGNTDVWERRERERPGAGRRREGGDFRIPSNIVLLHISSNEHASFIQV